MQELVLITVSGEDKPGLTASIMELLGEFDLDVLDVGQAVIHNYLSLGILINMPGASDAVLKEVLFRTHALDIGVAFTPISESSYDEWVGLQGRGRIILTLLSRRIRAEHVARVSHIVFEHGLNIDNIQRLSGRVPLEGLGAQAKSCVEFSLRGQLPDMAAFKETLMSAAADMDVDIAVQQDTIFRRNRRLVAFDMDSTLIDTEVIDELADRAGVGDQVRAVTERAMHGEMDFKESLAQRVALLKGLPATELESVAAALPLMEGAETLFGTLRMLGYKTAILSGGFDYFGAVLKDKLGIDYVFANVLEIEDDKLTGRVIPPIVDAERKATLLSELAARENISLEQVIAVGDGANDLRMLNAAGLGIAFHAKPLVKESAEQSISTIGLDGILYLMGIRDRDAAAS